MFADLPGYGYARISKARRAEWRPLIEGYLAQSPELRGIVELVDARHEPTKDDLAMFEFLAELGAPTIVVATKIDKLRPAERIRRLGELATTVGVSEAQVIPFSAVTGTGRDELAEAIVELIAQPSWRQPEE